MFWCIRDKNRLNHLAQFDIVEKNKLEKIYGRLDSQKPAMRPANIAMPVLIRTSRFPDVIWTTFSGCLIQDHVLKQFQEQGFTGFETRPVIARRKLMPRNYDHWEYDDDLPQDNAPAILEPKFWELVVTGWGGMAPPESGIELKPMKEDGIMRYTICTNPSKLIDEKQWDGSDFFIVWPLPAYIFVSDRVANFIRRQKFSGVSLIPYDKLQWDPKISSGFSPGWLHWQFPDERAHEIGDPLGIY